MANYSVYKGAYAGQQVDKAVSRALPDGALDMAIAAIRAAVGTPLMAATVADMTNHGRIYVYSGSETGMTAGHWYYWNGSTWADGGVYNSIVADNALDPASENALQNQILAKLLLSRNTYVSKTDLVYGDANALPKNSVVQFASAITDEDVANLPAYGSTLTILTLGFTDRTLSTSASGYGLMQLAWTSLSRSSGVPQFFVRTRWSHQSTTWSDWAELTTAKILADNTIVPTDVNVTSDNYSTSGFADPNEIADACLVRYGDSVTAEMVPNLPEYGRPWVVMTVRYSPSSRAASAAKYTRLQLAWSTTNTHLHKLCFRVAYSQHPTSWGDWVVIKDATGATAGFFGTSIMYGQTTGGARSVNNLPAMFQKATGVASTNNGVKGQGLVADWDTIYAYDFTGYDLVVLSYFGNDGDAWRDLPLGTGAEDETLGTTLLSYYRELSKKVLTDNPTAMLVWIGHKGVWSSNPHIAYDEYNKSYAGGGTQFTLNDLLDGVEAMLARYHVPFIDLRKSNPLNEINYETLLLTDKVHFTDAGYKKYAEAIIGRILDYYEPV